MQSTQQKPATTGTTSGFTPIPTRIRELPPLIVDREATPPTPAQAAVLERLAHLSRGLAQTHRAAAEAYLSQNQQLEALKHLEVAASMAPDIVEYQNQLGFTRYVCGDDSGAIEAFERVIAVQPKNPDALFNLGMVQFGMQEYRRAEECFRRSIECGAADAETWNNRGVCLFQLGRREEARTCFHGALRIDANNADAAVNLQSLA